MQATNVGISALKAIPTSTAVKASNNISLGRVFIATSDVATDKVTAGLGAWCHGLWWSCRCSAAEALIPIVVLESIAALVTFFTFVLLLGDPAATKHRFHLRIVALSSPQVLANDCAHAAVLEALHLAVNNTKLWQQWAPHMIVSHLHGIGNGFDDAAPRSDMERLARLAAQVKASPKEKHDNLGLMLAALLAIAIRTLSGEEMHISETQANNATKASHAMHAFLSGLSADTYTFSDGLPSSMPWIPEPQSDYDLMGTPPHWCHHFGTLPRPLTMQEMDLAIGQANTPTSASNVS